MLIPSFNPSNVNVNKIDNNKSSWLTLVKSSLLIFSYLSQSYEQVLKNSVFRDFGLK